MRGVFLAMGCMLELLKLFTRSFASVNNDRAMFELGFKFSITAEAKSEILPTENSSFSLFPTT